jgi:hypothetical protein
MPTQDAIMGQIIELVSTGAGGALPPEAESALRTRYYDWICEVKEGNDTSPQDIWDSHDGKRMQERIKQIGKHLTEKVKAKTHLSKQDCDDACLSVETAASSDCPHCPDPISG